MRRMKNKCPPTAETYSNINSALFYGGGFCFGVDPRREQYVGEDVAGVEVPNYKTKYEALQNVIKDNYQLFEVDYYGIDNDNYVDGEGFCSETKENAGIQKRSLLTENVDYEKLQYYYHSDHLGSASYITNLDGEVVQHIEYVPFGGNWTKKQGCIIMGLGIIILELVCGMV